MKVHLVGKNIELTDAIKDHLSHKINKKFQRLNPTAQLRVSLCVEKKRHIAHAVAAARVLIAWAHGLRVTRLTQLVDGAPEAAVARLHVGPMDRRTSEPVSGRAGEHPVDTTTIAATHVRKDL